LTFDSSVPNFLTFFRNSQIPNFPLFSNQKGKWKKLAISKIKIKSTIAISNHNILIGITMMIPFFHNETKILLVMVVIVIIFFTFFSQLFFPTFFPHFV